MASNQANMQANCLKHYLMIVQLLFDLCCAPGAQVLEGLLSFLGDVNFCMCREQDYKERGYQAMQDRLRGFI